MISKRGGAEYDSVTRITDFALTFVVAIFMFIVALTFINEKIDTHPLEADSLVRNLIYSDYCLSYSDGLSSNPGVIDVNRMSPEILKNCFSKDRLGYTVKLTDLSGREIKSVDPGLNLNVYIPICNALKNYKCSTKRNYIIFMKDKIQYSGILTTEVITLE